MQGGLGACPPFIPRTSASVDGHHGGGAEPGLVRAGNSDGDVSVGEAVRIVARTSRRPASSAQDPAGPEDLLRLAACVSGHSGLTALTWTTTTSAGASDRNRISAPRAASL